MTKTKRFQQGYRLLMFPTRDLPQFKTGFASRRQKISLIDKKVEVSKANRDKSQLILLKTIAIYYSICEF